MNGAENLLKTLEQAGMEVCFANPGTSEMHLVAAIGQSLARALPDNSIVVDEAATCGLGIFPLTLTGGAMGKPGPRLIEAMVVQQMP